MSLLKAAFRVSRPALLAVALAAAWPDATATSRTLEAQQVGDAQVKAWFLFNLAKFVEWPAPAGGALVLGIAGDNAFADVVMRTVVGRSVDGREFQTRRLESGDDPAGCGIVFIGAIKSHDEDDWLQRVRGSVLTVGESTRFLRSGGMVRLYVEDHKVRFQVNQKNAETAGLKISSQLLMLAAR
jgi:hypothetical protein